MTTRWYAQSHGKLLVAKARPRVGFQAKPEERFDLRLAKSDDDSDGVYAVSDAYGPDPELADEEL